jgi:hypothetical protein
MYVYDSKNSLKNITFFHFGGGLQWFGKMTGETQDAEKVRLTAFADLQPAL